VENAGNGISETPNKNCFWGSTLDWGAFGVRTLLAVRTPLKLTLCPWWWCKRIGRKVSNFRGGRLRELRPWISWIACFLAILALYTDKDGAGLAYTDKVSIENKEFRDPLLVLGRGDVIAATLPTTKPKNLPFTPKKKVRGGRTVFWQTAQPTLKNGGKRSLGTNIICRTSCCLHDEDYCFSVCHAGFRIWINVDCNLHEFSFTLGHLDRKLLLSITFTSFFSFYIAQSHFSRAN